MILYNKEYNKFLWFYLCDAPRSRGYEAWSWMVSRYFWVEYVVGNAWLRVEGHRFDLKLSWMKIGKASPTLDLKKQKYALLLDGQECSFWTLGELFFLVECWPINAQQFHHKSQSDVLREHLQDDSRPSSRQSLEPQLQPQHSIGHHARGSSSQVSSASYMQGSMGPPATQQPSARRGSSEAGDQPRGQSREGNYQPYSQNVQGSGIPSNAPPQYTAGLAPQGQNYRGGTQPSPMTGQGNIAEQDRRSPPPPSRSRDDLSNLDVTQLMARHDELRMFSPLRFRLRGSSIC